MDSEDFMKMDRAKALETALLSSDMAGVIDAVEQLENIRGVGGEVVYYRDDGEELAVIWWDSLSEKWLVNWLRGSGV